MNRPMHKNPSTFWTAALLAICVAAPVLACNVPVFRYALERWNPDAYEVFVFLDGPATAEQRKLIAAMQEQVVGGEQQLDSFFIHEVDVTEPMDDRVRAVHTAVKPAAFPHMHVQFPRSQPDDPPAYSGKFTDAAVKQLADSPVRRDVITRILDGESVVWVLLESGDKTKDDAAATLLSSELDRLKGELKLPDLDETDDAFHDPEAGPKLRMSFAVERLSRSDANEAMFIRLLENWDPKQIDRSQPMAFAVFGRGRVMPPLYGKYLSPKFIEEASAFLVGRCSCQVKEENPGWDLLMPVNWDAVMKGRVPLTEAMPKLTSPTAVLQQNEVIEQVAAKGRTRGDEVAAQVVANATPTPRGDEPMLRNVLIVAGLGVAVVFAGTLWLRSRKM